MNIVVGLIECLLSMGYIFGFHLLHLYGCCMKCGLTPKYGGGDSGLLGVCMHVYSDP